MSDIETGADAPGSPDRGILPRSIEDELRQSYLDYAMSVIVRRALPDVRDGLKPVHRRVLYSMSELGITFNRPPRKSAFVVGDVIAKYHPHGDSAVYETIVRMAQDFAMRYPLVDGQGNFGSIDRDPAAHQRYTEARMARIAGDLLADLDKETVDTVLNYDETISMPSVLPTRIPNLLVNGSQGIAVGMATNIPPHNLTEVIDACLALLDDPGLSVDDLMGHISGPDFPTGAIINGRAGIARAYRTGRGRIYVRARASVVGSDSGKASIVITEIPYLVNKAQMIERIAGLVKEKRIEGITEIRDESDREGLRVVIELRRGENGEVVLNNLYAQSQLQTVFGINCVALVDGQPRTVNLHGMLDAFLKHRLEVVVRRSVYLLGRARRRGHILEGQAVALENIDTVVELIRASRTPQDARAALMGRGWPATSIAPLLERTDANACRPDDLGSEFGRRDDGLYYLSDEQAQAILDLRLTRLTALEMDKLLEEYGTVLDEIQELLAILASEERQKATIREELEDVRERYGDDRRTEILSSQLDLTDEDLITEEDVVVTVSHRGYAKTQPIAVYQAQRRGGMGRSATGLRDEDFVEHLLVANSHDTLLCFSDTGKVYWLRVFRIPQGTRNAQGRPLVNLLPLAPDERITAILPLPKGVDLSPPTNDAEDEPREDEGADEASQAYVFMATANGTVKKTAVERFSRPRLSGLIALALEPGNTLVGVAIVDAESDVMLVASTGKAVRFRTEAVRAMGRTARGVRGIRLADGHRVIALIVPERDGAVLTASENGYGKRTAVEEFPVKGRAGQGVIAMQTGGRNGNLVGAVQVFSGDEIMLISDQGVLVRTHADDISLSGRNTKGVRLIRLSEDAKLSGLQRIVESPTSYGGTPPAPPGYGGTPPAPPAPAGDAPLVPETTH